ncbi:M-phase phosphoprotein 8-like [Patiria miniata]|uniref:Chromo domain-containing protein n=1 Tax=Patiria miniata TaxID=46514 RepID=A0A914AT37_PATMI|nr:M-phase phosphoprotein 8-like [Patiria miniata]
MINRPVQTNRHEVEKILATKRLRGKTLYKVRWISYGPEDDTWEPASHLKGCQELIEEFIVEEEARKSSSQTKPKVMKNTKVVVKESTKIIDMNSTRGVNVEDLNSRVTVSERGDWRDDALLRRSTLRGRYRVDTTPKMMLNSRVQPEKVETVEEDTESENEEAATSPFIAFMCIVLIILVILFIYLTTK